MNAPMTPLPVSAALPATAPGAGAKLALPSVALPAGSPALGAPAAPQAAFAVDLAKLLSLSVPTGEAAASLLAAEPAPVAADTDEAAVDALAALWVELGIATTAPMPGPNAHANPHATANSNSKALPGSSASPVAVLAANTHSAVAAASLAAAAQAAQPQPADAESALATTLTAQAELFARVDARPASNEGLLALPLGAADTARSHALPPSPVVVELRQPQAPQQIAESVVWQLGKGLNEVQIRLNPEDLGPLEVRLKLDGDKVAVRFDMADASVRDVVQTSLPQLATLLSARGLQLDQAQVFQQDRGQGQPQGEPMAQADAGTADEGEVAQPVRVALRRGLVDDYV